VTLDSYTADIDAVLDAAGVERCSIVAYGSGGIQAVAYAAMRPARVEKLALWAVMTADGQVPGSDAIVALAEANFDAYCETVARIATGWDAGNDARQFAAILRASTTADGLRALLNRSLDASPLLASVRCPTLVGFPRDVDPRILSPERARRMAATIPDARFVVVDGDVAFASGSDDAIRITEQFLLGVTETGSVSVDEQAKRAPWAGTGTAIILFADIADSTALTERLGDTAFRKKARALDDALRIAVRDNGGSVMDAKTLGDGILATFPAASQAIAAALACATAGETQGLPLHLGLHAGDVIREQDNVFGGAVNIAARVSALAAPGEVLVSRTVADLARTSAGVTFEDRGEHALKGVSDVQRVFAVRPSEAT
jgi:class 3 adenylate cyclase